MPETYDYGYAPNPTGEPIPGILSWAWPVPTPPDPYTLPWPWAELPDGESYWDYSTGVMPDAHTGELPDP